MYVLWFDLRKVCMSAYFPNTIEPCRKSIRDGELIRTFENWLSCLRYRTRSEVLYIGYVPYVNGNKGKVWAYSTNNDMFSE